MSNSSTFKMRNVSVSYDLLLPLFFYKNCFGKILNMNRYITVMMTSWLVHFLSPLIPTFVFSSAPQNERNVLQCSYLRFIVKVWQDGGQEVSD